MRDVLLMAFILGSLPFILRRPQIGVMMFVWLSVMNPHRLTWSFSYDFSFAAIVAGATFLGAVFSKDLRRPPADALMVALICFAVWTGVTTMFALYPDASFERWKALMKTLLIAMLIPMLFHRKEDLRLLLWVIVGSIAYYGTKGGAWTLLTGGEAKVWGPMESYIADNNAIAAALVMTIPLMRYLQLSSPHRYVRLALTAIMVLSAVAVLGTYSRGALVAVLAMLAFLWWRSKHKISLLLLMLVVTPVALLSMPGKWYERMDTIATYGEERSAQMRLNAWQTMMNVAKDRPIVGGGFELAYRDVYQKYAPDPGFPPQVAHSIYFQALGEHGFVGLAIYLLMFAVVWHKANRIIRLHQHDPGLAWATDFARMMQVTVVAFAVGGAFLSLVNFDVPYYLIGTMVATVAILSPNEQRATTAAVEATQADLAAAPRQ